MRGNTRLHYQFPRNAVGGIDPTGGKIPPPASELKMKYEKEARFMTGMCLQLDDKDEVVFEADPIRQKIKTRILAR